MNQKTHKKCKSCGKDFRLFKTTDKFCSFKCVPDKEIQKRTINKVSNKQKEFDSEYEKNRKALIKEIFDKNGKIICERCYTDKSIMFSTHHIMFRSEYPRHPMLHSRDNLIHLCYDCHEYYHDKKSNRDSLVKERGLIEKFK